MARLSTIADVVNWLKIDFGSPVVCIELPDTNIYQIIEDVVVDFQKYAYTEGAYEAFIPIMLSAGVGNYDVSGQDFAAVVELKQLCDNSFSNLNTVFSSDLSFLNGDSNGQGLGLSNFESNQQYIDLIDHYFKKMYRTIYRPGKEELVVMPTPTEDGLALVNVYKKEAPQYIFNNNLFKKLVKARVMIRWGFVLNKRTITFPGGGTVNGEWIYNEGKELEAKIEQQILDENTPPRFMVG